MTTNEQRHGEQVRLLISLMTDEEMRPDIIDISNTYKTVRMNLLAAARGLKDIDGYSLDDSANYIDLQLDLHQMMLGLRSDELALLELISNMTDSPESVVHDGSNEFAGKNDVIISGMSDTELLSHLDGKAY